MSTPTQEQVAYICPRDGAEYHVWQILTGENDVPVTVRHPSPPDISSGTMVLHHPDGTQEPPVLDGVAVLSPLAVAGILGENNLQDPHLEAVVQFTPDEEVPLTISGINYPGDIQLETGIDDTNYLPSFKQPSIVVWTSKTNF